MDNNHAEAHMGEKDLKKERENFAETNFDRWNDSLQTKDAKKVAELYSDDATFLPTVSGKFKKGKIEAEEYFSHFLEKNPIGVIIESETQLIGENCYLHSGMYNFEVGPEGERQTVEARFSFVWQLNDKKEWEIIHHHSSVKPE